MAEKAKPIIKKTKPVPDVRKKPIKKAELTAESTSLIDEDETKEVTETGSTKSLAKAGKRSAKATLEQEVKAAKQERKTAGKLADAVEASKATPKVRSRSERAGKKYREALKLIEKDKRYSLEEALSLAIKTSTTKFDSSVELHVNLGVDPKQADQNVRDNVVLPGGTGKSIRIAVLAEADDAAKAKKAGADISDADKLFADLEKENIEFDVLISTPQMMAKLGKFARMLGPRGLMPNPKSGTVTANVVSAIEEAKAGKVEYRVDQAGIIHMPIGKVSFGPDKLLKNSEAVMASVRAAKPGSIKGIYIKAIHITTTMGPSIMVVTNTN